MEDNMQTNVPVGAQSTDSGSGVFAGSVGADELKSDGVQSDAVQSDVAGAKPEVANDGGVKDDDGVKDDFAGLSDDEALDLFVDKLVETKGYKSLTPEMMQKIKRELKEQLVEFIDIQVMNALPEATVDTLEGALRDGDKTKVMEAFKDAGVDYGKVVSDTMIEFGEIYLEGGEQKKEDV
jgi:hypothetical protein